ncbi:unnamed protein product [Phaedon cochleariae]|uniref:LEM domain-containing protein n=1 Tax=Phaedon cochleariae TaxID=80249 RepID=A0A9P0DRM8_PHACE|nr:unnamed protein product [Phaedon cochleariae]
MVDVEKLSDAELRTKLLEFGFPVMPITGTTRKVMAKKLKMLLDNKNKIGSDGGRRSMGMGRYSSEEDSDSELKTTKRKDNRRITMAAPIMQPPSSNTKVRKSTRLNETFEPEIATEISSPVKRDLRTTTTSSSTTRTQKLIKAVQDEFDQDEFDTGSDSESDVAVKYKPTRESVADNNRSSPVRPTSTNPYAIKYSPPQSPENSYSSRNVSYNANASPSRPSSYNSPSLASEYASDRLNQIRSRLSLTNPAYETPSYSSNSLEKEETPFLSNFTRRLSALSNQKSEYDENDVIKEHDSNGSSYPRSPLSNFRSTRGRDTTYDYKSNQNNILKNNFVSFAVLAGAALFFVVLAIMYMGMRSDTSVIPSDYVIPKCIRNDATTKKGVNCLEDDDIKNAIDLLMVLKPELQKRAIANKCFDITLKPHMTESEIINFCVTNFALNDAEQIRGDLRNLEILTFNNPQWGLNVVQTEDNNGLVSETDVAKNMEQVVFNYENKVTSLVMLSPELPWKCTFYKSFYFAFSSLVFVILIFGSLYLLNMGFKQYKLHEQKQKDEIGFMVEKIIDILQSSASEEGGENFVVINHVRDMILPVIDRQKKRNTWAKAVKFINENESRVRTEVQEVKGEPFEVWRWIGSANISVGWDRSEFNYRHGRRIIDVEYFLSEVLKFPHKRLRLCNNSDVKLKHEVREGFVSVFVLHCQKCQNEYSVCSEDPNSELMNANLALVAGIVSLGLGLYQLNELCSSLHIPAISGENYNQYLEEICEIYNETEGEVSEGVVFDKILVRTSTPKSQETVEHRTRKDMFLKDLAKTPEEIEKLSKLTLDQGANPLWFEERKKRLTASNFGRICKLLESTDRKKVAQELLHSSFMGNIYTRYGNDNEENAIRDFQLLTGKKVINCGLFIDRNHPFLAASPDGLIDTDAIVEVKCPYKAKDVTPEEGIKQKLIQFATFENGVFSLKRTDKYYYQVQGQLFVTGRSICYFIVWTQFGLLYEQITKDEGLWNEMFPKLKEFYFQHLLPTILEKC